jgi:hypothetical protein
MSISGTLAGSGGLLAVGSVVLATRGDAISGFAAIGADAGSGVSLRDRRARRDCPVTLEVFRLPDFFSFIPNSHFANVHAIFANFEKHNEAIDFEAIANLHGLQGF